MALVGNRSVLHKSPGRFLNGYGTTGGGIASMRSAFNKHGMQRNAYQAFDAKSATPYGHLSGSAWVLPKTAGGMSSRNVAGLSLSPIGFAVGGVTADATASITFTVADAQGQLISSGAGSASMVFSVADLLLTASLNGVGSASLSLSTNAPLLGAIASATGAGSMAFSGALQPYAIGVMVGTTAVASNVVNANIVSVNGYTVQGTGQPGTEWGP